jgi:gluconate 2-dehydrogenase alpha chain
MDSSNASAPKQADVVLIGLGAAGGIAAQVLAEAGMDVVALEAGPRIDPRESTFDELRNDVRNWMSDPKAKLEVPVWRFDSSQAAGPSPWPMLMANGVGGSTMHYECISLRFQPWNFEARTKTLARYGPGAIPGDSTLADWPVSYRDLEPYYDSVERAIGVSGLAGRVRGEADPLGNPFEGERSRGYPMPPLRPGGWGELMTDAGRRLGWHPYPGPAAINSEPYGGHPACTYCGFCSSNGCHANAKGSTAATVIKRAESTGRLRVETSARVTTIDVDSRGYVSAVRFVRDGVETIQPALSVLLGAFTYENVRLLLASSSAAFPSGLANNHDQVGRHFTAHTIASVYGRFPGQRLNLFTGTMAQAPCVDDWNCDNFDHSDLGFVGGGMLACWGEFKPITAVAGTAVPPHVPRWGSEWKRWVRDNIQSVGVVRGQFDALPYEECRLDLDPVARDAFGTPRVRVTHQLHSNELNGNAFLIQQGREWLLEAGAAETWDHARVEGRHAYGGTRSGPDPETSVVDSFGFAHEVPNLGIIGASTFPTTGGHNPTLTVQATAWRTAQHLVDDFAQLTGGS